MVPARVGLLRACDDPELFGFEPWPVPREWLAAIERGPRLQAIAAGRRSSKSLTAALVGVHTCVLRPDLRRYLRPRERGHVVAVATNLKQARLLVAAARSIVERSPLLAGLVEALTEDEIHFSTGWTFSAFACTSRGARGWPVACAILDEFAHFVDNEGNSAAESVWRALLPSTAQFGSEARVIACSTPWGDSGLFAQLFEQARSGELTDAVAHHATTRQANPTITEGFLEAEQARDPESFRSEYLAEFVGSGGTYLDPENIRAAVTLPGELRPEDCEHWIAALDPSFSSDPFGLAVVGRDKADKHRLLVGLVRSWIPPKRKARSLEEGREVEDAVLSEVARVLRPYQAAAFTDQFRAAGVTERLRRYGINVRTVPMTAPTKDAAFGFLRGRLNAGEIELYEHPQLLRELRAVRTRYAAGRSSVVLPRVGGSHCDLAQSLALACFAHDRHAIPTPLRSVSALQNPRPRRVLPANEAERILGFPVSRHESRRQGWLETRKGWGR